MDDIPDPLRPVAWERVTLPSGDHLSVPVARPVFPAWHGEPLPTYGGKQLLHVQGAPAFAEIAILTVLKRNGWDAIWVDSYGRRYLVDMPHLPNSAWTSDQAKQAPPCLRFPKGFARFGGCWDVIAWKGDRLLFCESKRAGRDVMRQSQLKWLEQRLAEGARTDQFLIVEWNVASPVDGELALPWLQSGAWYAWNMYPGYAGVPYQSPIFLEKITWERDGCTLSFYNAGYAQGVRDMTKRLTLNTARATFAVMTEEADLGRCVVISTMSRGGLRNMLPDVEGLYPIRDGEDTQTYLTRLRAVGHL